VARIESVNIGKERPLENGRTGIFKGPVQGAARINALGVEGDCVSDKRHHGGPDQAVYVYFADDYASWAKMLGHNLAPGTFGDNLTISGLASADIAIGDRLDAGDVVLEVTAPRIPCNTLAARMGDPGFVKAFRDAERPGAYCRVIKAGTLAAGARVTHQPFGGERIGIVAMFRDWFVRRKLNASRLREVLAAPIAARARADWEQLLAAIERRA
jgi:MOSC domain-containing protein YiiM